MKNMNRRSKKGSRRNSLRFETLEKRLPLTATVIAQDDFTDGNDPDIDPGWLATSGSWVTNDAIFNAGSGAAGHVDFNGSGYTRVHRYFDPDGNTTAQMSFKISGLGTTGTGSVQIVGASIEGGGNTHAFVGDGTYVYDVSGLGGTSKKLKFFSSASMVLDDVVVAQTGYFNAANFYVAADGSNSADGSEGTPWQTIQYAIDNVSSGDTIEIREGIYREHLLVTEGLDGLTLQAATNPDGSRQAVLVSGAEVLSGWTHDGGDVYWKTVSSTPNKLFINGLEAKQTRTEGWSLVSAGSVEGSTTTTIKHIALNSTDPLYSTTTGQFAGAKMFYRDPTPVRDFQVDINSYANSGGSGARTITIKVASPFISQQPIVDQDYFYLFNDKSLLGATGGDWAIEGSKLYVYSPEGDPDSTGDLIEMRQDGHLLRLKGKSADNLDNVTIDGLRIGFSNDRGILAEYTNGLILKNNAVYQNGLNGTGSGYGVNLINANNATIENNILAKNKKGLVATNLDNSLISGNEVYKNLADGIVIAGGSENNDVIGNYIHDHNLWEHPDGFQTFDGVTGLTFSDNVMFNNGSNLILQEMPDNDGNANTHTNVVMDNNMIVGQTGLKFNFGKVNNGSGFVPEPGAGVYDLTMTNTTLAFGDATIISNSVGTEGGQVVQDGRTFERNVVYHGYDKILLTIPDGFATDANHVDGHQNYKAKDNVYFIDEDHTSVDTDIINWDGDEWKSLAEFKSVSGQETGSTYENPNFLNGPVDSTSLDGLMIGHNTRKKLYVKVIAGLDAGDHVEINADGIAREIESINSTGSFITLKTTDQLDEVPLASGTVMNWGSSLDLAMDLRSTIANRGSDLVFADYQAGDFDGDGIRDLPVDPLKNPSDPPQTDSVIAEDNFNSNNGSGGSGWEGNWGVYPSMDYSGGNANFGTGSAKIYRYVVLDGSPDTTLSFKVATGASSTSHTQIGYAQVASNPSIKIYSDELSPSGEFTVDLSSYSGSNKISIASYNTGFSFTVDDVEITTGQPASQTSTIGSENFSSNNGSGGIGPWSASWSTHNGVNFSGGNANLDSGSAMWRNLDISGYSHAQLTFDVSDFGTGNGNMGYVSINGVKTYFDPAALVNGKFTLDLSSYSGTIAIKFATTANYSLGMTIDNISVTGDSI